MDKKELKKIRSETGLSQEKMASFLNVSFSCYSKWEQGVNPISELVGLGIKAKLSHISEKNQ